MYFGNRTIRIHLLRGILGIAAGYASLSVLRGNPWPSLILFAVAIYLLKGCPLCWTLGLIETIVMTIHRRNERKFDSTNSSRVTSARAESDSGSYILPAIRSLTPASDNRV